MSKSSGRSSPEVTPNDESDQSSHNVSSAPTATSTNMVRTSGANRLKRPRPRSPYISSGDFEISPSPFDAPFLCRGQPSTKRQALEHPSILHADAVSNFNNSSAGASGSAGAANSGNSSMRSDNTLASSPGLINDSSILYSHVIPETRDSPPQRQLPPVPQLSRTGPTLSLEHDTSPSPINDLSCMSPLGGAPDTPSPANSLLCISASGVPSPFLMSSSNRDENNVTAHDDNVDDSEEEGYKEDDDDDDDEDGLNHISPSPTKVTELFLPPPDVGYSSNSHNSNASASSSSAPPPPPPPQPPFATEDDELIANMSASMTYVRSFLGQGRVRSSSHSSSLSPLSSPSGSRSAHPGLSHLLASESSGVPAIRSEGSVNGQSATTTATTDTTARALSGADIIMAENQLRPSEGIIRRRRAHTMVPRLPNGRPDITFHDYNNTPSTSSSLSANASDFGILPPPTTTSSSSRVGSTLNSYGSPPDTLVNPSSPVETTSDMDVEP